MKISWENIISPNCSQRKQNIETYVFPSQKKETTALNSYPHSAVHKCSGPLDCELKGPIQVVSQRTPTKWVKRKKKIQCYLKLFQSIGKKENFQIHFIR